MEGLWTAKLLSQRDHPKVEAVEALEVEALEVEQQLDELPRFLSEVFLQKLRGNTSTIISQNTAL